MAQRVVSTLLDRVREVTRIEQQAEKLAALGQLAGNLAHELNNPASAAQRAAASLLAALRANRSNRIKLIMLRLTEEQMEKIEAWEENIFCRSGETLDPPAETDALGFIRPRRIASRLAHRRRLRRRLGSGSATGRAARDHRRSR